MAIDMSTVTTITLDNQDVTKIEDSLGNVLWQKGSGPTPTEVIDKFPDATNEIVQGFDGGPISDYTIVVPPYGGQDGNEVTNQYPVTVDGETYPLRVKLIGYADPQFYTALQINVASNSTVYLICSSTSGSTRTIYIDGVSTSYKAPIRYTEYKVSLSMTSGIHTIGFDGNAWIWGIVGDLVAQNLQ